jgi:hypothetical protein
MLCEYAKGSTPSEVRPFANAKSSEGQDFPNELRRRHESNQTFLYRSMTLLHFSKLQRSTSRAISNRENRRGTDDELRRGGVRAGGRAHDPSSPCSRYIRAAELRKNRCLRTIEGPSVKRLIRYHCVAVGYGSYFPGRLPRFRGAGVVPFGCKRFIHAGGRPRLFPLAANLSKLWIAWLTKSRWSRNSFKIGSRFMR